jgi:hypothetical protein
MDFAAAYPLVVSLNVPAYVHRTLSLTGVDSNPWKIPTKFTFIPFNSLVTSPLIACLELPEWWYLNP